MARTGLSMHIFVDESGTFSKQTGSPADVSAMAALVVPDSQVDEVIRDFVALKTQWGVGASEIKGSALSELQAAELIRMLRRYDVILIPAVIDLGFHAAEETAQHKRAQADKITKHLSREHTGSLIQDALDLQSRLLELADQLYAQAVVAVFLVNRVIRVTTMYYSQRRPEELGAFHWVIDAKDREPTEYEKLWKKLVLPILQTASFRDPHIILEGMDYSHFDRFKDSDQEVPAHLAHLVPDGDVPAGITDIRKLMFEHFSLAQSEGDLGVQMADLCCSVVTRSLRHTLQPDGFVDLGSLMVQWEDGGLRLISLSTDPERTGTATTTYGKVVKHFNKTARPMFLEG